MDRSGPSIYARFIVGKYFLQIQANMQIGPSKYITIQANAISYGDVSRSLPPVLSRLLLVFNFFQKSIYFVAIIF